MLEVGRDEQKSLSPSEFDRGAEIATLQRGVDLRQEARVHSRKRVAAHDGVTPDRIGCPEKGAVGHVQAIHEEAEEVGAGVDEPPA